MYAFVLYYKGPGFQSPSSGLIRFWQTDSDLRPRSHQAFPHLLPVSPPFQNTPNTLWQVQILLEVNGVEATFSSRTVLVSPKPTNFTSLDCGLFFFFFCYTGYSLKPKTCGTCVLSSVHLKWFKITSTIKDGVVLKLCLCALARLWPCLCRQGPGPHLTVATSPRTFLLFHHKLRTVTANVTYVVGCKLAEVQACGLSCTVYVAVCELIMLSFKKSVIIFKCHC